MDYSKGSHPESENGREGIGYVASKVRRPGFELWVTTQSHPSALSSESQLPPL